jgi:rubrerythrin
MCCSKVPDYCEKEIAVSAAIPSGSPQTLTEAFGHIYTIEKPTIDDLKVMVLVEAAGLTLYEETAKTTDNKGVQDVLRHNGREEMAHAHRVSKAIRAISGEEFLPPAAADNPYLAGPIPTTPVTVEGLTKTAEAEFGGDALYARWADAIDNEEAAALFRLNGREESDHGNRLMEAVALLAA